MRSLISTLMVSVVCAAAYFYFLKRAAPVPGMAATQAISITGVEADLTAIAQAERMYFAQNGSYASIDQLVSSGDMALQRSGRDGYSYAVETSQRGFTVSARHAREQSATGAPPPHYPTFSINESMQIRQSD